MHTHTHTPHLNTYISHKHTHHIYHTHIYTYMCTDIHTTSHLNIYISHTYIHHTHIIHAHHTHLYISHIHTAYIYKLHTPYTAHTLNLKPRDAAIGACRVALLQILRNARLLQLLGKKKFLFVARYLKLICFPSTFFMCCVMSVNTVAWERYSILLCLLAPSPPS
jgi:hypothetical protein